MFGTTRDRGRSKIKDKDEIQHAFVQNGLDEVI